jgi:hypothetical protein
MIAGSAQKAARSGRICTQPVITVHRGVRRQAHSAQAARAAACSARTFRMPSTARWPSTDWMANTGR